MTCSRLPSEFHVFASFLNCVLVLRILLTRHFDDALPSLTVLLRHCVLLFMALQVLEDLIHHCLDDHDFKVNPLLNKHPFASLSSARQSYFKS